MGTLERELADWNSRWGDDNGRLEIGAAKREPCRHEPTLIFSAQGVGFWGASISKVNAKTLGAVHADLLINLTGFSIYSQKPRSRFDEKPVIKSAPAWFARLFKEPRIQEVVLNWPDMGVIPVGREFFQTIWKAIKQQQRKNIVVFCVGGHGRTGTCVASFMTVINGIHGGQAIRHVREQYCSHAIETKSQETMVRSMTQRTISKGGAAPSK
jgi:hypothetical protein